MLRRTLVGIMTLGLMGASGFLYAEQVTVEVIATVTSTQDTAWAFGDAIQPGTKISGAYVFETTTADVDPAPDFAHHPHAPGTGGFDLDVAGIRFKTDLTSSAGIYAVDVGATLNGGEYHVASVGNLIPLPGNIQVNQVSVDLMSWGGVPPLSSTELTSTPPDPARFEERSLKIYGTAGNTHFQITAHVDSMRLLSDQAIRPGLYTVEARIVEVHDPSWTLQGRLDVGDTVSGAYQLDPSVQDQDMNPETALYEHPPVPGYGFSLTAGPLSFASDSSVHPVTVHVGDNGGYDVYDVSQFGGTAGPELRVNDIHLHLGDPSGQALSSTDLIQTPDVSRFMGPKDLIIAGSRPDGSGFFQILAGVVSIATGGEPAPALALLPGDGQFLPMQRFDLGILIEPGYQPFSVSGSVNGHSHDYYFSRCYIAGGHETTGHFAICPDADALLDPIWPESRVKVDVKMTDGTTRSGTVTWELLQP